MTASQWGPRGTAHSADRAQAALTPLFLSSVEFEAFLDAVPDALVGVDESGVIRFANHQMEVLFGYDRLSLIGAPLETLLPESLRPVHQSQRQGYFASPRTRHMGTGLRLQGRHREGTDFPVDISLSHIDTGAGPIAIAAVRDMTRYYRAEEERRLADRQLATVEYAPDAIVGTDLDGIVTIWNPAAERMFGYTADEIVGNTVKLVSGPAQVAEVEEILHHIRAGAAVGHHETTRVRKDGTAFPIHLTISPTFDPDGTVVGSSSTARDESAAWAAFEAARAMIEASLDSLVALSPQGMITDANQATSRLTGVPRDELIGTEFSRYFTDPDRAGEVYQRVLAEGTVADYPLTMVRRDGRDMRTEVLYNAAVYRDGSGAVLGVFAAARDMTSLMASQRETAEEHATAMEGLAELEKFHRLVVGREVRMFELKQTIADLSRRLADNNSDRGREG